MTMTTIAAIAAEYEIGEMTALDLLGLEPEDANIMFDADRAKWVRERLNEATRGRRILGGSRADTEGFISSFTDPDDPEPGIQPD